MKRKLLALAMTLALAVSLIACGESEGGEGDTSTVTGMVVSVNGTVLTIVEMDNASAGQEGDATAPSGFGNFGGGNMPWGDGNMPSLPEGETMPDFGSGNFPGFSGEGGATGPNMENFASDAETRDIDIGQAHISVEIDGGKATGSLEDLKAGVFVTITMDADGNVTNVLVSQRSGFSGQRSRSDDQAD